jgi:hypothetical protein
MKRLLLGGGRVSSLFSLLVAIVILSYGAYIIVHVSLLYYYRDHGHDRFKGSNFVGNRAASSSVAVVQVPSLDSKVLSDKDMLTILKHLAEHRELEKSYNELFRVINRTIAATERINISDVSLRGSKSSAATEHRHAVESGVKFRPSSTVATTFIKTTSNAHTSKAVLLVGGTDGSGTRRVVQILTQLGTPMVSEDPETYDIHADIVEGWPKVVKPVVAACRSLHYAPSKLSDPLRTRTQLAISSILAKVASDSSKPTSYKVGITLETSDDDRMLYPSTVSIYSSSTVSIYSSSTVSIYSSSTVSLTHQLYPSTHHQPYPSNHHQLYLSTHHQLYLSTHHQLYFIICIHLLIIYPSTVSIYPSSTVSIYPSPTVSIYPSSAHQLYPSTHHQLYFINCIYLSIINCIDLPINCIHLLIINCIYLPISCYSSIVLIYTSSAVCIYPSSTVFHQLYPPTHHPLYPSIYSSARCGRSAAASSQRDCTGSTARLQGTRCDDSRAMLRRAEPALQVRARGEGWTRHRLLCKPGTSEQVLRGHVW